jgi:hypothetical protein
MGGEIAWAIVVELVVTLVLAAWGRWVAKRHEGARVYRYAAWGPWISLALRAVGTIVTVVLLVRAFGATTSAPPDRRAIELADSISDAMLAVLIFAIPGYVLLLASSVVFVVGSLRRPNARSTSSVAVE